MTHDAYVLAAYGVSAVTLLLLVAALMIDQRGRRRDLAALEAAGVRRRSEG